MKYHSDGSPLSDDGFEHARLLLDVDAPTLWAVLHVETGGFGYLPSRRPVIRFERHVFHQLTAGRFDLEQPEISNPLPGGYIGGPAEYVRLNSASMLDADAALQSASWGIGQLMGYNFEPSDIKTSSRWSRRWSMMRTIRSSRPRGSSRIAC